MVHGMEKAVDRAKSEEQEMPELFFSTEWNDDRGIDTITKDDAKDQMSKDLNIPWHQIGSEQVQIRRDKGFEPVDSYNSWKELNEEEKGRMANTMSGASLRKDLEFNGRF